MINDNKKLASYLDTTVNSVFKILPLYEEKNVGVIIYIESLMFEIDGLKEVITIKLCSDEHIALLANLASLKNEIAKDDSKKPVVKREVFKCINIIKNMIGKLTGE